VTPARRFCFCSRGISKLAEKSFACFVAKLNGNVNRFWRGFVKIGGLRVRIGLKCQKNGEKSPTPR